MMFRSDGALFPVTGKWSKVRKFDHWHLLGSPCIYVNSFLKPFLQNTIHVLFTLSRSRKRNDGIVVTHVRADNRLSLFCKSTKLWHDDVVMNERDNFNFSGKVCFGHGFVEVVFEGGFHVAVDLDAPDLQRLGMNALFNIEDLLHTVSLI